MALNWISTDMTKLEEEIAYIASDLELTGRGEVWPLKIKYLHPGRHQRSAGAWSWVLIDNNGLEIMGSCYPAREIIKAYKEKKVSVIRSIVTELLIEVS